MLALLSAGERSILEELSKRAPIRPFVEVADVDVVLALPEPTSSSWFLTPWSQNTIWVRSHIPCSGAVTTFKE